MHKTSLESLKWAVEPSGKPTIRRASTETNIIENSKPFNYDKRQGEKGKNMQSLLYRFPSVSTNNNRSEIFFLAYSTVCRNIRMLSYLRYKKQLIAWALCIIKYLEKNQQQKCNNHEYKKHHLLQIIGSSLVVIRVRNHRVIQM